MTPQLPGKVDANSDRREYLRNYLLGCLRDNVLSKSDFSSWKLPMKLYKTLTGDLANVGEGFLRELGFVGAKWLLRSLG